MFSGPLARPRRRCYPSPQSSALQRCRHSVSALAFLLPASRSAVSDRAIGLGAVGAIVSDGFDWTAFHRFFTEGLFLRRGWLLIDVGMATIVVAAEIRGRGFPAEIAVDALVIDVELSLDVFGILICDVRHVRLGKCRRRLKRIKKTAIGFCFLFRR